MSRPGLARVDTLDLQDHQHPSAQSHIHPANRTPNLANAARPDGADDRAVAEHGYSSDQWGSGRSSHEGSELLEEDPDFLMDNNQHDAPLDELALQQNGGAGPSDDSDMIDGDVHDDEDDDMTDKISSSPSISDEDIDFEFVYALHTFVATVEGQANATKGDTMVLLDDSNSYWWLVRVVKDNSIGYLPAEHIETPTERLARLNKHRNIDLAQSMLGDMQEKSKNPLKKAMRRRNAKVVQFSTPTYFEAAEHDWSDTDPDRHSQDIGGTENRTVQQSNAQEPDTASQADSILGTEVEGDSVDYTSTTELIPPAAAAAPPQAELAKDDPQERSHEDPRVTRNGTIRNTDSFFKDDSVEPKKISLTPNLLREESSNELMKLAMESREKAGGSTENIFDQIEKLQSPTGSKSKDAKGKKDSEKKPEKKPGMLSGLFKRSKDKKIKVDEAAGGVVNKRESEIFGSPTASPNMSGRTSPDRALTSPLGVTSPTTGKRPATGSKLSKNPPPSRINTPRSPPNGVSKASIGKPTPIQTPLTQQDNLGREEPRSGALSPSTNANIGPNPSGRQELSVRIPGGDEPITVETKQEGGLLSPLGGFFGGRSNDHPKREKLKPAKERMDLNVDSSPEPEESNTAHPGLFGNAHEHTPYVPDRPPPAAPYPARTANNPNTAQSSSHAPYSADTIKEERSISPISPVTPTDGTVDLPTANSSAERKTPTDTSSYTTGTTRSDSVTTPSTGIAMADTLHHDHDLEPETEPVWDDAALRRYLEDESSRDVHDLLLIINDKTNVVPVSHDHPILVNAGFHKQQQQLQDMSDRLDGLLSGYLSRKKASRKTAAPAA